MGGERAGVCWPRVQLLPTLPHRHTDFALAKRRHTLPAFCEIVRVIIRVSDRSITSIWHDSHKFTRSAWKNDFIYRNCARRRASPPPLPCLLRAETPAAAAISRCPGAPPARRAERRAEQLGGVGEAAPHARGANAGLSSSAPCPRPSRPRRESWSFTGDAAGVVARLGTRLETRLETRDPRVWRGKRAFPSGKASPGSRRTRRAAEPPSVLPLAARLRMRSSRGSRRVRSRRARSSRASRKSARRSNRSASESPSVSESRASVASPFVSVSLVSLAVRSITVGEVEARDERAPSPGPPGRVRPRPPVIRERAVTGRRAPSASPSARILLTAALSAAGSLRRAAESARRRSEGGALSGLRAEARIDTMRSSTSPWSRSSETSETTAGLANENGSFAAASEASDSPNAEPACVSSSSLTGAPVAAERPAHALAGSPNPSSSSPMNGKRRGLDGSARDRVWA